MKKKIIIILIFLIIVCLISILGFKYYQEQRIKNATIEVSLVEDLTLEWLDKKRVSDYITSINGGITDDYFIDSTELGEKEVTFNFKNEDNIKLSYTYKINIVDTQKPVVWLSDSYSVPVNSSPDFINGILCGDNYDSKPTCIIEGNYNLNQVGNYPVTFKATDNSGNEEVIPFTLNVYKPSNRPSSYNPTYLPFSHFIEKYKTDKTEIGIDVSKWQGDIDFKKIKDAGVEFIIIRVGSEDTKTGEYFVDSKFVQNIKAANDMGLKAGIYFYTYADSIEHAINDANFVLEQIKPYKIDLPIAFDWEEWSHFNSYNLSFYELTNVAKAFLDTVSAAGYEGMLYGSKNYLKRIWMDTGYQTWLAHYIDQTTYDEDYTYWQLSSSGVVNGIRGAVDIDIRYLKD